MWRLALAMLLAAGCACPQPLAQLMLPESRHIGGIVVDPEGEPISGAYLNHTGDYLHDHQTDAAGRFELDTKAPALVIRKAGYRSELLRTEAASEVRITLQPLAEIRTFPTCPSTGQYYGMTGARFQFQKIAGMKAASRGSDIDYATRTYFVAGKNRKSGILHGNGVFWSFGLPLEQDVWRSASYQEIVFAAGRINITDARGAFASGNRWRYLGMFGESASYSDVDPETAAILDEFLDGACLKATAASPASR